MKWGILCLLVIITLTGAVISLYALSKPSEATDAISFINVYGQYAELAEEQRLAIGVPGGASNEHRKNLNLQLENMLTEDITDEERLLVAEAAKAETDGLRKQIEVATAIREKVEGAIKDVESQQGILDGAVLEAKSSEMIEVMKKRQVAVAELAATLYAINGQTEDIVDQIIADGGALTDGHILSINNTTNDAEQRFERLTQEYQTLDSYAAVLDQISTEFVAEAW